MSGRIFLFGDDIDTDQLAPGHYMRGGIDELSAHCLEGVRPGFAGILRPGDIVVAGRNFGMGSSREQAAEALLHLGAAGVVALSFAGIFYRNAINLGLAVLVANDLSEVEDGDPARLDVERARLRSDRQECGGFPRTAARQPQAHARRWRACAAFEEALRGGARQWNGNMSRSLKERLRKERILLAPGVYDAITGLIAEQAGAEAVYLSGASIAYTRFGRPDIGLVSMSEVADTIAVLRDRIALPIVVDADNGFGNALNVQRTVRVFERMGANALQLEDQTMPKRCGHLDGKSLISTEEMAGKIRAACDARASDETLIIGRTDAIAVEGFEAAVERAEAYVEAGADMLFIEAPQSLDEIKQVVKRFSGRVPLMANMVEGGKTPIVDAAGLEELGFSLVIFPGGIVRALAATARDYYSNLVSRARTRRSVTACSTSPA